MHISKIFGPLEAIESGLSELYGWFETLFHDDTGASRLFGLAAIEETVHANLIQYQRRLATKNAKMFGEVHVDMKAIEGLLDRIREIRAGNPPTLEQAVGMVLFFENSAVEQHYLNAAQQANPEVANLLRGLATYDCRHLQVFQEFAEQRGFRIDIKPSESLDACFAEAAADAARPPGQAEEPAMPMERRVIDRINLLYAEREKLGYYTVLGIRDYATEVQIRQAYHKMAKEYHPDRYPYAPADIRQKLTELFSYIHDAYVTLMDSETRKGYDQTLTKRVRF